MQRRFAVARPNELCVVDFTYVATCGRMVYVAFVIDVFLRYIVGWRASATMRTDLALKLFRRPIESTQYLAIRHTRCLAAAGIEASFRSREDLYDNALAESVIGLFKSEVPHRQRPRRSLEAVEFATLSWVQWFPLVRTLGDAARRARAPTSDADTLWSLRLLQLSALSSAL